MNTVIQCASKGCRLRRQWEMYSLDARHWKHKVSEIRYLKAQQHAFDEDLAICFARFFLGSVLLDLL